MNWAARYYYDARYLEALDQLGLESDGSPKDSAADVVDWTLDTSEMVRSSLTSSLISH